MLSFGVGLNGASQSAGASFSVSVSADNLITINADGSLSITITEPAEYAGTYATDSATVSANPVALVPPAIENTGTIRVGDTVTASQALWLHDDPDPSLSWELLAGSTVVATSDTPSFTVPASALGEALTVRETALQQDDQMLTLGMGISTSAPSGVVAAANHLTQYFVHDGAFRVTTPASVIGVSDVEFLLMVANEIDAGASQYAAFISGTISSAIDMRGGARFDVWDNLGNRLRENNTQDFRGQLTVLLYHVTLTGGTSATVTTAQKEGAAAWATSTKTDTGVTGVSWNLSQGNMNIVSHGSITSGKLWRVALWPSPGAIDVTSSAFQDLFVDSEGRVKKPADSIASLGTPTLDWNAEETNAAAGGHGGSLGALTVNTAPTIASA